jgi:hypothetical protein
MITYRKHKLNQIITEYGLNISEQKTKSMAFKGRDPIRSKVIIDNKIIQVNLFSYLGNLMSYENEMGIDNKLNKKLKLSHHTPLRCLGGEEV